MTNLSGQGNMFTEATFGENVGEIKEELSGIDLGIGNLSVSPTPHESSCVGTDESSVTMAKSNVSGADLILSAFDSINIAECLKSRVGVATDIIKADACDSIGQANLSGQSPGEGKDTSQFDSLASTDELSAQSDGRGDVFLGTEKTCKPNPPLIVYTSSRRSARNTKVNQNNESQKTSKYRRMAMKNSVIDLSSLQILRKSRSSFSKRARSSGWGYLGNILPDFEENSGLDQNLGDEKKLRKVRRGKGKRDSLRDQTGRESVGKRCTPTGKISLKIKIGNKICTMGNAAENLSAPGKDTPELFDTMENKLREKVPGVMVSQYERTLEKVTSLDASALRTHLDVGGACDDPSFNSTSNFHPIVSPEDGHNLGGSIENLCSDVGTSPDSEVINPLPDAPLCEKVLPDMQDSPIMSKASVCPSDTSCLVLSPKKSKKGNKKANLHQAGKEINLTETSNNAKVPISKGDVSSLCISLTKSRKGKKKDKLHQVGDCSAESQRIAAETINDAKVPADLEVGQNMGHPMVSTSMLHLNHAEINPCSGLVAATVSSNPQVSEMLIPCSNGQKFTKCSRAKGGSKGRSRIINIPKKKDKASKKKRNKNNVGGEHQPDEIDGVSGALSGVESCQAAGNQTSSDLGESGALSTDLTRPNSLQLSSAGVEEQYMPLRNAWVLCDECQKWRRIPALLADQIEETNCGWTCKDNTDEDFANCSIPQEKSNSEINEELEISDEEDACGTFLKSNRNTPKVSQKSSWSLIKSNLFLHRSRKTQTIDEVMVCHCKLPTDGRMGCGAKCLNRMLNIECVQGTCPCGELCSNQQFQKRKYAKLKWFRCGKKGYGLQALQDISQGQFIIEYVGEVLDVQAYEARQREYGLNGHKHFYFMTLNGSEVIDACAKGNLGRFINHSCDPNCRTEKWMVNGEVCVGLFSLRDIKKGEEVTFDYNYVRVFGAAAKKCVCGSPNCQGYIGGDPASSEVIVQDDSDDEFSEPIMTCDDRELNEDWRDIMSNSLIDGENITANEPPENRYNMKRLMSDVGESITESHIPEYLTQKVEGVDSAPAAETIVGDKCGAGNFVGNKSAEPLNVRKINSEFSNEPQGLQSQMHSSPKLMDVSLQTDGILSKATPSVLESAVNAASPSKSLSDTVESKRKLKYAIVGGRGELAKSNSMAKTKRSSSSVKNGKPKTNDMNDKGTTNVDKLNTVLHKPKKLPELTLNSHFEAVEEKLNELLDPEGGISKRKDASRGYLKLLFLTAASGNNGHGEAIQSNRDLSMILDALLKTKSRTVLVDIINKNGLQMLHNIMKRYRKDFIKTPILRKLLKVLEHLALREILTLEHITGGPPRAGVESFKDSILILTEHADRQVHQIARNFRDRWIPRSLRKNFCMERDDARSELNQCSGRVGLPVSNDHWNDRGGNPSEVINSCERQSVSVCGMGETSTPDLSLISGGSNGTNGTKTRKRKSRWDNPVEDHQHSGTRTNLAGDEQLNIDEDIPPGFSSPCKGPLVPSDAPSIAIHHQEIQMHIKQHSCDIILGDSQLRFVGRMPLSYGVPYSVMQQFGVLKAETSEGWNIAPGIPFHPFPPLPPYARGETRDLSTSASCASLSEHAEKAEQSSNSIPHCTSQKHTRTCSLGAPENNPSVANRQPDFQQGVSCGLGRRYFRQQKWNHSKLAPPWVRMRNGWGHAGNNMRSDSPGVSLGNGANEFRNLYNSQEINWRG